MKIGSTGAPVRATIGVLEGFFEVSLTHVQKAVTSESLEGLKGRSRKLRRGVVGDAFCDTFLTLSLTE